MGYWYIDRYDITNEENIIHRIGHADIPGYLKIYSGDYPKTWADAFNVSPDKETEKAIAFVTASRIAQMRREHCVTKKQVADKLGITLGAYNAYELAYVKIREGNGSTEVNYKDLDCDLPFRVPTVSKIIQLAKSFDCSVEWLIGVSDDETATFEDYNKEKKCDNISSSNNNKDSIEEAFNKNFGKLTKTQQGILYGKLCEMLCENGMDV